jgi:SAM-dependent methyltransferase
MPHEGMVHALEEAHRLLRPTGRLIEIHPAVEVPFVVVKTDGTVSFVEPDPGYDYEDDLLQAEAAVSETVDRGMFVREDNRRFELRTHAASVGELRHHFEISGAYDPEEKDPALVRRRDEMYARADEALERPSTVRELIYVEPARMTRLTPTNA